MEGAGDGWRGVVMPPRRCLGGTVTLKGAAGAGRVAGPHHHVVRGGEGLGGGGG